MNVVGEYDFAGGAKIVKTKFAKELKEIISCIESLDREVYRTKQSKEAVRKKGLLYSPVDLNKAFKSYLNPLGWENTRVECEYPNYYLNGYEHHDTRGAFRDMDFVKNKLGVEVQFGKYSFMVYNVAAKMTIFKNLGVIEAGVEIVPVKELAMQMSTGVSYFEQFTWDLDNRGISNIDTPVLILGIV